MECWSVGTLGQNYDGVMGRSGDGEKKIIFLRVPESPFPRVFSEAYGQESYSNSRG